LNGVNKSVVSVTLEDWKPASGSGSRQPPENARYANFFRIGSNAFEFLLQFGQAGRVHTSISVSPQEATMLHELLQEALEKYQSAYGVPPGRAKPD
jgi:hypothetical protein